VLGIDERFLSRFVVTRGSRNKLVNLTAKDADGETTFRLNPIIIAVEKPLSQVEKIDKGKRREKVF
jgi:hypothetical protein